MLAVGSRAPVFIVSNQDDTKIKLSDFKSKWVVLYFYPKDNTSGCTVEALEFTKHAKDFEKLNAVILGVSPDSCESHQKFIEKHNLGITLLSSTDKELLKQYGVWQKKSMYGREYMGVVRTTYLINPQGKIALVWDRVKPQGHAEEVLHELKNL